MGQRYFAVGVCALAFAVAVPLYAGSTGPFTAGATTGALHMPQGEDAGTANGDFLSDNDAIAITGPYRYFIEVPAGATKLQVDLYDADVGISATEGPLNRDRDRGGYNTTAVYRLFNPAGGAVTPRFTTGTNALPVGADANWMVFYSATGNTVADTFATNVYTRNDGNNNWATNWVETDGGGGGSTGGAIQVTGGRLEVGDNVGGTPDIYREADLLGTPGLNMGMAFLTFDLANSGNLEGADQVSVQISSNGGGAYTTLETFAGNVSGARSYDITNFIANNTRVRFLVAGGMNAGEFFFFDNVQIADGPAITAGHWELQVDMTTAGGDDINAVGIRAHDGDSSSAGTEFNVYADSMVSMGVNPDGSGGNTKSTTLYPWVVAGCTCQHSDFDRDSDGGDVGSQRYTSRLGTYVQTFTSASLSPDDTWMPNATDNFTSFTNFTSNQLSVDYGIWELFSTINTYINTSGNYETVYLGNYLVGATPPTTNPIVSGGFPATFRLYLPTDGNTAPVKPYLKQSLTAVNGPQPAPAIGVARTYTVSVSIVNPTPFAITFSATNLVIANVPGSGTVYAGPASVSQGGAPTTPVVGGTGNVSWNPGTVAAGGTATMAYNITVTPAAATTNATGTPASGNGTRATYVDETGNTTQARATYRLGGICELRVVVGALTEALLSSFEADRGHVAWTAASEAGTIGYNLYRQDGTKVNDSLIPAGRQKYEIDDRSMSGSYFLEEITANGQANRHGPLTTYHRLGPDAEKPNERPMRLRASAEAAPSIVADAAKTTAVMVGVRDTGIVRVPFSELATRFGKPLANIANSAEKGSFSITTGGENVAFTSDSDSLLFFGEKTDSIYSNERIYRVDQNKGDRMSNVAVSASNAGLTSFNGKAEIETDAFAAAVLPLNPESDYWFWDYIVSGDATNGHKTFPFTAHDVASASGATLEVRLQGALKDASHIAHVKVNGVPVGDLTWSSLNARTANLNLPAAVLQDGANQVEIEGELAPSAPFDVFYIDGFTLRYQRYARPVGGAIEAAVNGTLSAGPFTVTPLLLDITNRRQPKVLTGGSLNAGTLGVTVPSATKSVFASQQFVTPASYRSSVEPPKAQRADYIVIAPASMRSGAQALASLRQGDGGLRTMVVDLEQIYDDFSNGETTPHAIRAYIASALQQKLARPRYIVLAGTGTLDYRGIQQAPGPVPPMMVKTNDGLFASDSKIADADNDGIPDIAIGRIPVSTNAELLAYVDKLRDHAEGADHDPIVFVADAIDATGTDFGRASDDATQPVLTRPRKRLHMDDIGPQATRDGLIAAWTAGTPLVNWMGHGGFDQLSGAGVITAGDAPSLVHDGRLPVLVAMTCTINRFEVGGIAEPLGSALTRQNDGGALAVWSATGLSNHENARVLQRAFIQLAAANPQLRLGDLIVQTLAAHPSDTAGIYVLLGDPAIALELPKEITNGGTPPPSGE
jgi:hypothetical protein